MALLLVRIGERLEAERFNSHILQKGTVQKVPFVLLHEYVQQLQLGNALFYENQMHAAVVERDLGRHIAIRGEQREIAHEKKHDVLLECRPVARQWVVQRFGQIFEWGRREQGHRHRPSRTFGRGYA